VYSKKSSLTGPLLTTLLLKHQEHIWNIIMKIRATGEILKGVSNSIEKFYPEYVKVDQGKAEEYAIHRALPYTKILIERWHLIEKIRQFNDDQVRKGNLSEDQGKIFLQLVQKFLHATTNDRALKYGDEVRAHFDNCIKGNTNLSQDDLINARTKVSYIFFHSCMRRLIPS
jgi:polyhydroxyalkanoate synthesis regulator phasin